MSWTGLCLSILSMICLAAHAHISSLVEPAATGWLAHSSFAEATTRANAGGALPEQAATFLAPQLQSETPTMYPREYVRVKSSRCKIAFSSKEACNCET